MNPPSPDPSGASVNAHTGRTTAVVLAAGLGTRMRSAVPKVLHPLCGRPMLAYVLDAWSEAATETETETGDQGGEAAGRAPNPAATRPRPAPRSRSRRCRRVSRSRSKRSHADPSPASLA